ncbi:MAG: ABC transporter ATP-binding protein [Syntrophomonadaceae bacterium]|jgi:branched-chain amino acid transport system ATP-binding protein
MSILRLVEITQEFGGLRALEAINLEVSEKEIFGIIGPNGAGKTTLFNIITGIYVPTEGELIFRERRMNNLPPYKVACMGIARTFQNIRLFNKLSVFDNVRVGTHGVTTAGLFAGLLRLGSFKREDRLIKETAENLLEMVGLQDKRWEYAQNLSYGEQRRLEIARALALKPTLLLLDEPAAGMNSGEKVELMKLIHDIRQEMNLTLILVEHDMDVVMNICERIAVLDYGRKIAEGSPEEVKNDEKVIQSYLGVQA